MRHALNVAVFIAAAAIGFSIAAHASAQCEPGTVRFRVKAVTISGVRMPTANASVYDLLAFDTSEGLHYTAHVYDPATPGTTRTLELRSTR